MGRGQKVDGVVRLKLTGPEVMREWDYRYAERLGMLCGAQEPTPAQRRITREAANEWIRDYRQEQALRETFEME